MEESLWTKEQAASYHQVTVRTIDNWVADGKLQPVRYDGSRIVRFHPEDVKAVAKIFAQKP